MTFAGQYATPERSLIKDTTTDAPLSIAPTTPRPVSTKSSSTGKISKDAYSVGKAMEQHGLVQDDNTALNRYPLFEKEMREIVTGQRLSAMKKGQVEEFHRTQRRVERLNEDTVLNSLLPLIIRREYQTVEDLSDDAIKKYMDLLAKAPNTEERDKIRSQHTHTNRLWSDDGLLVTSNCEFQKTLLPNVYEDLGFENELAKALSKADGMKNPKPDRCFGLTPESFPTPRGVTLSRELNTLLEVAPGLIHPFFIIEGKADKGELAQARNQAARGGATLVRAFRLLLAEVDVSRDTIPGPDRATVAFSATLSPDVIEIWIHWADVVANEPVMYHMNRITGKYLHDNVQVVESRRVLHNILNWGCNTRRKALEQFHQELYEHRRREQVKKVIGHGSPTPSGNKRRRLDIKDAEDFGVVSNEFKR